MEIYNEGLKDLLTPDGAPTTSRSLKIRHDTKAGGRGIYIDGVRQRENVCVCVCVCVFGEEIERARTL